MPMDGAYLRRVREEKNFNQEALAHAMRISVSQLSRYENNKKVPAVDEVERAADFLRVPLLSLIGPYDGLAEVTPHREADELLHILTLVLSALLEAWEVPTARVHEFVRSLLRAYKTPEALSPNIPAEHQVELLAKSLARELSSQQNRERNPRRS